MERALHGPSPGPGSRSSVSRRLLSSPWFGFLVVFILAAVARFLYLAEVRTTPDFNNLVLDSQWYHLEALRVAVEGWMPEEAFFRAPGYPYLLALIFRVAGEDLMIVRVIQILLSSIAAGLILWLGWKIYGKWVGWVAGLLAAAYGLFIYFSAELLATTLVVVTALAALALLVRAEARQGTGAWFLAGVALGVSALVRPTILVFGLLAFFWAKGWGAWRSGWERAAAFALGVAVCVAPVTIVNYLAGGELVWIAHQGGVNYYIGNNPQADGKTALGPGEDAMVLRSVGRTQDTVYLGAKLKAEEATRRELRPSEVSRFWLNQSLQFVRRHPGRWIQLQARKLYYFWNSYEIDNNRDIGSYIEANSPSLRLPHPGFWLIGSLGLAGLALSFRRGRTSQLLGLFVIAQMAAVVAFFVCARFRMPAVAALIILAALVSVTIIEDAVRRSWRRLGVLCLALLIAFPVVNTRGWSVSRERDSTVHLFNQATAYMDQGLYDRAIGTYLAAIQEDPLDAKIRYALGSAYLAKGLYDRAVSVYNKAVSLDRGMVAVMYNDLGVYFLRNGRLDEAEEKLNAALETEGGFDLTRLNLALVYSRTGRRHLALEQYRRILEMPDVHPQQKSVAYAEIAIDQAAAGRLQEALEGLRRALKFDGGNETARLYLGDVLERLGRREQAVKEWRLLVREATNEAIRTEAQVKLRRVERR